MSGLNDFDFFIGKWRVHHRRLKERLAHNDDWEQFEGTSTVQKILGDRGNLTTTSLNYRVGHIAPRRFEPTIQQSGSGRSGGSTVATPGISIRQSSVASI